MRMSGTRKAETASCRTVPVSSSQVNGPRVSNCFVGKVSHCTQTQMRLAPDLVPSATTKEAVTPVTEQRGLDEFDRARRDISDRKSVV